ncbi:MAG: hypothetical protein IPN22_04550 [Bacteroidetes bacterium]|nr:hypothetical protein [Bacteroidota bacterium]
MSRILFACLLAFPILAIGQEKQYNVGVVAFYNLENLFDTLNDPDKNDEDFTPTGAYGYTAQVYHDKLGKLSQVLSELGTQSSPHGFAFCGVAEVENRKVLEDLVAQPLLKNRNLKIVHYSSPDERGIDVGLLYNPKYFKVKHSESLFVKLESNSSKPYYTRDVLWVSGDFLGEMIHIFVNHWPSRRGGEDASAPARAAAAAVSKHVIDSLMAIDPTTKVVVMGDLNDDPVSPSVTQVIGAVGKIKEVKPGGMFNPWVDFYKKGIGTLAYNDSWNIFDQILLSSGWLSNTQPGFFYKDAHIFNKQYMVTKTGKYKGYPMRTFDGNVYIGGYSDHFPTYCVMLKEAK